MIKSQGNQIYFINFLGNQTEDKIKIIASQAFQIKLVREANQPEFKQA